MFPLFRFSLLGASHVAALSVYGNAGLPELISSVREPESREAHGRPRCCHRCRSAESPAACRCSLPGNPSTQSQPLCRQFRPRRRRCCLRWTLLHHQVRHHVINNHLNGILLLSVFSYFILLCSPSVFVLDFFSQFSLNYVSPVSKHFK